MADILVRYKNNRYRMWNTVVDQWITKIMNYDQTIKYLMFNEHTKNEAIVRVNRKNYKKDHLHWLNKFFDSRTSLLSRLDRTHRNKKPIFCGECHAQFGSTENCQNCRTAVLDSLTNEIGYLHENN
jgi:hypothetical protein